MLTEYWAVRHSDGEWLVGRAPVGGHFKWSHRRARRWRFDDRTDARKAAWFWPKEARVVHRERKDPMTISQPKVQKLYARLDSHVTEYSHAGGMVTRRDLRDLVACLIDEEKTDWDAYEHQFRRQAKEYFETIAEAHQVFGEIMADESNQRVGSLSQEGISLTGGLRAEAKPEQAGRDALVAACREMKATAKRYAETRTARSRAGDAMTDDLTAAISRLHRTSVSGDVDADIALVLGALESRTEMLEILEPQANEAFDLHDKLRDAEAKIAESGAPCCWEEKKRADAATARAEKAEAVLRGHRRCSCYADGVKAALDKMRQLNGDEDSDDWDSCVDARVDEAEKVLVKTKERDDG